MQAPAHKLLVNQITDRNEAILANSATAYKSYVFGQVRNDPPLDRSHSSLQLFVLRQHFLEHKCDLTSESTGFSNSI